MAMRHNGLAKLAEELGELQQIVGKMLQYPDTDDHPDGNGSLRERMEDEMGDVAAASLYVEETLRLNGNRVSARAARKLQLFRKWQAEE